MKKNAFVFGVLLVLLFISCQAADKMETEAAIPSSYCLNPEDEANDLNRADTPYLKLFESANYAGWYYYVSSPNHLIDFSTLNINDAVSSIQVFNGAKALLYYHWNYNGPSFYVTENVPNLNTYGYDNLFSSLKWFFCDHYAVLYQHPDYTGNTIPVFSNMPVFTYLNDQITSIRLVGLKGIRLYEDSNYLGFYYDYFTNNQLLPPGSDDRASSVSILC